MRRFLEERRKNPRSNCMCCSIIFSVGRNYTFRVCLIGETVNSKVRGIEILTLVLGKEPSLETCTVESGRNICRWKSGGVSLIN